MTLLRVGGATPGQVAPFTVRPPLHPTPLGVLAAFDPGPLPLDRGVPPEAEPGAPPPPAAPLPARAQVVIIGGGIMGLGLAYNLCRRGETDVVVLERGYLNSGASGRNGGGVRAQWSTPTMVRLARRSQEIGETFAAAMGMARLLRPAPPGLVRTGAEREGWGRGPLRRPVRFARV